MSSARFSARIIQYAAVLCPLCGTRPAKRACPALGHQICAVCCATKRLTEIHCPNDCAYLAASREHPAATVVRRQQRDAAFVMHLARDFSERQSQLFLLVTAYLVRGDGSRRDRDTLADTAVIDADVAEAMRALASTYETSVRGVIYEHRPASLPAQRLVAGLKPLLDEAGKSGGTSFERDVAVVLRRVEEGITKSADTRAFLDLLGRVFAPPAGGADAAEPGGDTSRLIVP